MCTCNYSVCSYVQVACKPCTDTHSQTAGLKYRSLTKPWTSLLLHPTSQILGWQLPCLSTAGSGSCRFSLHEDLALSVHWKLWGEFFLQSLFPCPPATKSCCALSSSRCMDTGLSALLHVPKCEIQKYKVWH